MLPVNELSNTIELIPILTRAESLFHRFERKVQAIDKKDNFPTPSVRHRKTSSDASAADSVHKGKSPQRVGGPGARTSGSSVGQAVAQGIDAVQEKERVISPELRQLLSREVITVDKGIRQRGDRTS